MWRDVRKWYVPRGFFVRVTFVSLYRIMVYIGCVVHDISDCKIRGL